MNYQELEPKSLRGFSTPYNQEANDIENYLGVTFRTKPSKIRIGIRNSLALPLHITDGADFFHLTRLYLTAMIERKTLGVYVPAYNAYFYKSEDPFVARHENMHAYVDQRNPSIREFSDVMTQTNHKSFTAGDVTTVVIPNLEMGSIQHVFGEGLAQWAAVHIGLQVQNDDQRKTAIKYHNKMMLNQETDVATTPLSNYAQGKVKVIQDQIDKIKRELRQLDKNIPIKLREGKPTFEYSRGFMAVYLQTIVPSRITINEAAYYAGYYFVYRAIRELRSKGLTIPDVITTLVDSPPTLARNLGNPGSYAKTLIQGNN